MASFDLTKIDELRARFAREGFLVLEGYFSGERVDALNAEVVRLLADKPLEVVVDSRITAQRTWWADTPYRETERFKFNDLYLLSATVREVALDAPLSALLGALLGEPAVLCNSLNFKKGSSDHVHIDSLFMTPRTPGSLAATWTSLEDVHPDAGPLTYFPGSHLIPLYRFSDGSRHAIRSEMPAWLEHITAQLRERGIEEKVFLAKKGDVFIGIRISSTRVVRSRTCSERERRSCATIMASADARALGGDLCTASHGPLDAKTRAAGARAAGGFYGRSTLSGGKLPATLSRCQGGGGSRCPQFRLAFTTSCADSRKVAESKDSCS